MEYETTKTKGKNLRVENKKCLTCNADLIMYKGIYICLYENQPGCIVKIIRNNRKQKRHPLNFEWNYQ